MKMTVKIPTTGDDAHPLLFLYDCETSGLSIYNEHIQIVELEYPPSKLKFYKDGFRERFSLSHVYLFSVSDTGLISAKKPNPAVPSSEIFLWRSIQGLSWDDIVSRIRQGHYLVDI